MRSYERSNPYLAPDLRCWPLRSALEHLVEMQSSSKGYLPTNDLKLVTASNEVKAEDQGNDGAAASQKYAHQPATRKTGVAKSTQTAARTV